MSILLRWRLRWLLPSGHAHSVLAKGTIRVIEEFHRWEDSQSLVRDVAVAHTKRADHGCARITLCAFVYTMVASPASLECNQEVKDWEVTSNSMIRSIWISLTRSYCLDITKDEAINAYAQTKWMLYLASNLNTVTPPDPRRSWILTRNLYHSFPIFASPRNIIGLSRTSPTSLHQLLSQKTSQELTTMLLYYRWNQCRPGWTKGEAPHAFSASPSHNKCNVAHITASTAKTITPPVTSTETRMRTTARELNTWTKGREKHIQVDIK